MGNKEISEPEAQQKQLRPGVGVESLMKVNVLRSPLHPYAQSEAVAGCAEYGEDSPWLYADNPALALWGLLCLKGEELFDVYA